MPHAQKHVKKKDAYPKKVCHMLKSMSKKRNKDAYPKKVYHMPTRHVKKKRKEKRKIDHIHGKNEER